MIALYPYDQQWPLQFLAEKGQLQTILGREVRIEHIGSTAVSGIHAKPVIDILIGVLDLNCINQEIIQELNKLRYIYQPQFEIDLPFRRFFIKDDVKGNRTHHLHIVRYPSSWWARHIVFRDYLRSHSEQARQYEAHKLALSQRFNNTLDYSIAKNDICRQLNESAYMDFNVHHFVVETERLYGYIPQESCFDLYKSMFQDDTFIHCYGVSLSDDSLRHILKRDTDYWDQYGFAPYVWFDKVTKEFVGEGGLNHTTVEGVQQIELTYSLRPEYWGKGLAAEIGRYMIDCELPKLSIDHIVCFTTIQNKQSQRVMEKLGFQYHKDFIHAHLAHRLYQLTC